MRFGLDRHVGGLHDLPNPGDLLCAAVAACEDGTLRMIAALPGITVEELEVEVSGKLDVRGGTRRERRRAVRFCVNPGTLRNGVHVDIAADV